MRKCEDQHKEKQLPDQKLILLSSVLEQLFFQNIHDLQKLYS